MELRQFYYHVQTNEIKFRHFGDIMTPLLGNGSKSHLFPFLDNGVMISPKRRKFISLVFLCLCFSKSLLINTVLSLISMYIIAGDKRSLQS